MKSWMKSWFRAKSLRVLLVALMCTSSCYVFAQTRIPLPELPESAVIALNGDIADWPNDDGDVEITLQVVTGPAVTGKLVIRHEPDILSGGADELFVHFDIADNNFNPDDRVLLMFDLSHDEVAPDTSSFEASDDRGIMFRRLGAPEDSAIVYGLLNNLSDVETPFPSGQLSVVNNADGWTIEARILPGDLGLNSFNSLMGGVVYAFNGPSAFSRWPDGATTTQNTWANIITRPPIDFVLVMDQSGSMAGNKWTAAKQAGNNLRAVLGLLNDGDLTTEFESLYDLSMGDRLGLVSFTTAHVGNAKADELLVPINSTSSNFTGSLPSSPSGGTPLVAGINEAIELFGGADQLDTSTHGVYKIVRQKVVILNTDGYHNSPGSVMDFENAAANNDEFFSYLPDSNNSGVADCLTTNTPGAISINPVGIGSSANPPNLDDIKDCFSGSNIYNITGTDAASLTAELSSFYFTTLFPYYHLNELTGTAGTYTVAKGERKLLFFAFWPDAASVSGIQITGPDATVYSSDDAVPGERECLDDLKFCYLFFDKPLNGNYTNFDYTGTDGSAKFAWLDLRLEALFGFDNEPHGTSSSITLRSRLREDGRPITGATVKVDITKPIEGFGTVASTVDPDTCKATLPTLPDLNKDLLTDIRRDHLAGNTSAGPGAIATTNAAGAASSSTGNVDIQAPKFILMQSILDNCDRPEGLRRASENALTLYDDGTHGDVTADDGLYTLEYDNTEYEGSYVFQYYAQGTAPSGRTFNRFKEVGEYIRVDVDPYTSETGSRILTTSGTVQTAEYFVIPKDIRQEYKGPGFADKINFTVGGGLKIGGVNDYNNGIYTQVVRYDSRFGNPVVVPTVDGVNVTGGAKPGDICHFKALCDLPIFWIWIILFLLVLLVFMMLLLLLRCCRAKR